jgi:CrcB protein
VNPLVTLGVALGAGAGAQGRYGVEVWHARWRDRHGETRRSTGMPWATLAVNVAGSGLLGFAAGLVARGAIGAGWLAVLGAGVAGGLTTFSTFAFNLLALARVGRWRAALLDASLSLVLGLAAAVVCYRLSAG